jgi:Ca2+-binding RTX toxin-like protein
MRVKTMPGFPSLLDLGALGSNGFVVRGAAITDNVGFSVASAGDVNGDGFDDFLFGSPSSTAGVSGAGSTWVVFGKASGFGTVLLGSLAPADGFRIDGEAQNDAAGYSVASAGDINGDGFDDIILGAEQFGTNSIGAAYVVFGKASGFTNISLATMTPADGFEINGTGLIGRLGHSVSSAGDINDDGYDDIIVGAPDGNTGNSGTAYVIFGKAGGFANIDVTTLSLADGFTIKGAASDRAGIGVSSAGDINNDGYADIIVGAEQTAGGKGGAYVLFGKAGGFSNIDLGALAPADGFKILGRVTGSYAGAAVSSAGDFNNDGFDDLLVGAPFEGDGGPRTGASYILFGKAGGFATVDLAALAPADGFKLANHHQYDMVGSAVSAGDLNGDGYGDVIIGANGTDGVGNDAGAAYVLFGRASGFATVELGAPLLASEGFKIIGDNGGDFAGMGVSAGGDLNNDGYDDIIVGAPNALGANEGAAYVIFGRSSAGIPTLDNGATDARFSTGYTEDGPPVAIVAGGFTLTSGVPIGSMTIEGGILTLAGAIPAGITATGAGTSTLILTGSASAADYASALSMVRYSLTGDNIGGTGSVSITVDTGIGPQLIGLTTIALTGVDDAAIARDDDFGLQENAASKTGNVLSNNGHGADSDVDGPALSVAAVNGSPGNVGTQVVLASGAILTLNASGNFVYDPNHAFDATPGPGSGAANSVAHDSFTYTLTGGGTATVTMSINGVDSEDFLISPAGANTLTGGNFNDTYLLDHPDDNVSEFAGGGLRDVVYVQTDYTLDPGVFVEVLSASNQSGTAPLELVGNELGQEIYGNAGDNFLQGGGGTDYLVGLGGNDRYLVTGAGDNVIEGAGGGARDVIYAAIDYTLAPGLDIEVLSSSNQAGTGAQSLTGNALAQEIYGNQGANFIDGGAGADYLAGFGGNDIYAVDQAGDVVAEGAGGGRDVVYAQVSYALAAGQEIEVLSTASQAGTAAIDLTGNALANELYGNAGVNTLNGGAGADYLAGYGGADKFAFTTALGGGNIDQIADFLSGTDTIQLDDAVFTGLTPGALPASAFVIGTAAADADDRIIYDSATGRLFFDADGNGAGAAVQFATLEGNPIIAASDFTVI